MGDGVADKAIDAGGGSDRRDAVEAAEVLRGDVAGSGFFSGADRGEGENAAGADTKDAADDALLPHAQADQRVFVGFASQELDHGNVIGKSGGSARDFLEFGGGAARPFPSLYQPLRPPEVVESHENG